MSNCDYRGFEIFTHNNVNGWTAKYAEKVKHGWEASDLLFITVPGVHATEEKAIEWAKAAIDLAIDDPPRIESHQKTKAILRSIRSKFEDRMQQKRLEEGND